MADVPYAVIVKREPDGRYVAVVPAFPEVRAYGLDAEETLATARSTIARAIEARRKRGDAVPPPEFHRR